MGNALRSMVGTGGAVVGAAIAGGRAGSGARSAWYAALDKPSFQPPGPVFPVAWTLLYADIAVTSGLTLAALRDRGREAESLRFAAALAAGVLAISSADLVRRAGRVSPAVAGALAPYPAWCGFATVLSTAIWRRNR